MTFKNSISVTHMSYTEMLLKPFMSMWDNIMLIVPAIILSIGMTILNAIIELTQVDVILVIGLLMLMTLDLITGLVKAYENKNMVTSLGLRQTSIKFIEYFVVCAGFVILSNMTPEMQLFKKVPFMWLAMVEMKSIIENVSDKKGTLRGLFEHFKSIISKNTGTPEF